MADLQRPQSATLPIVGHVAPMFPSFPPQIRGRRNRSGAIGRSLHALVASDLFPACRLRRDSVRRNTPSRPSRDHRPRRSRFASESLDPFTEMTGGSKPRQATCHTQ